jgi:predicted metal-dependent hydrolase
MSETLVIGDLTFDVRRSARRKNLGLTVDRGAELVVHAPLEADGGELTRWMRSKLLWVHRKLAQKDQLIEKNYEPEFVTGETFSFLGRSYRLAVVREAAEPLALVGEQFRLAADARVDGYAHFRRWYIRTGRAWLGERVAQLARKTGVQPQRVEVRDLGYRWGSCGRTGTLNFNWRLLQLPARLIDYVIVHELAHLIHPNHGLEFKRLLNRALPSCSERERELGLAANAVHWCRRDLAK